MKFLVPPLVVYITICSATSTTPAGGTCRNGAGLQLIDTFHEATPVDTNLDATEVLEYVKGLKQKLPAVIENVKKFVYKVNGYNLTLPDPDIKNTNSPLVYRKLVKKIKNDTGAEWREACTNAFEQYPIYGVVPSQYPQQLCHVKFLNLCMQMTLLCSLLKYIPGPLGL